jgi:hypothetical protein
MAWRERERAEVDGVGEREMAIVLNGGREATEVRKEGRRRHVGISDADGLLSLLPSALSLLLTYLQNRSRDEEKRIDI